jgi:hypothetical protein
MEIWKCGECGNEEMADFVIWGYRDFSWCIKIAK